MFGFEDEEEAEALGSVGRYPVRQEKFRQAEKQVPWVQHHFWWVVHNCVAHMAIGIVPHTKTFAFHDWTSRKLNAE